MLDSIKKAVAAWAEGTPRNEYNEINIRFYKDALHEDAGEHGRVVVSNKVLKLDHVEVPFVFPGMSEPPVLTARLMIDIESAGASQGYVVHYLLPLTYGALQAAERQAQERALRSDAPLTTAIREAKEATVGGDHVFNGHGDHVFRRMVRTMTMKDPQVGEDGMVKATTPDGAPAPARVVLMGVSSEEHQKTLVGNVSPPPVTITKLKEGSTEDQIKTMENYLDSHFPAAEYETLAPWQKEEIQTRVLLQVNNDLGRGVPSLERASNAKEVIDHFRKINVSAAVRS